MKTRNRIFTFALTAIALIFLFGCKSAKPVIVAGPDESISVRSIIKNHYKNELQFKTLRGRVRIAYNDGRSTSNLGVSLRMQRDKAIWISAPLGVVKAYITPDRVSFYNKLDQQYFDGDFVYLSRIVGTDLDFNKVQNILFGQALFDLRQESYEAQLNDSYYQLKPEEAQDLFKTLFNIEPTYFKLASQRVSQPWKKRLLEIRYLNYKSHNNTIMPTEIGITAIDLNERTQIDLEYRNLEFDRPLNFPYKIPKGYEEIVLE
ncbi:MAG: DUF4292 domain-containing protein [Bacteroidia bacterium]|nr:DUF4292 domain-containing protein [Bacteroidia bacterium]